MCLYSCCPTCRTLSIWAVFPSDAELQNINWMCTYRSHWNENSQSDFVKCTPSHTVSCFFTNYIVVDCGTPSSLSNGQRRYSSTKFGSTVTYTCNTGYRMTAGSSSRTCQSNGQWSGSHPTCSSKSTLCHYIIHCILTTIKHAKELLALFSMHNDPGTPVNAGTPKDTLSITPVTWDSSSLELLP